MTPETWLTVMLGIPVALIATYLWLAGVWLADRIRFGEVDMAGAWAEWIESGEDRCFSVGTLKYRWFSGRYVFDGTNSRNDGRPFCYWRSAASHFGHDKSEYTYVFATKDVKSFQTASYGYGVVNLAPDGKRLVPAGGFYMYSVGVNASLQRDHTMLKVNDRDIPKPGQSARALLEGTFPDEWRRLNVEKIEER